MSKKLLLAYATRFGSTKEIAEEIGSILINRGFKVDLYSMEDVTSLQGYQAVVLGSAINHGNWLPIAIDFLNKFHENLKDVPLAIFSVHITNLGNDEQSRLNRNSFLDEVHTLITPDEEIFFAGKFNREAAKELIPAWIAWLVPKLDFRKRKEIRNWSENLFKDVSLQIKTD